MKFIESGDMLSLYINVNGHYPIQGLFNLLRDHLTDKFGSMELVDSKYRGLEIHVYGEDDKPLKSVYSLKNMIVIEQSKDVKVTLGSMAGETVGFLGNIDPTGVFSGISKVTDNVTKVVGLVKLFKSTRSTHGNIELIKPLGEEIEKLLNDPAIVSSYFSPEAISSVKKSKGVAIVLSLFLGILGIDRFYLGYIGMGILKLITFGLFGILWFIDLVRIIVGNLRPKDGSY
jgi:hypothetical protein